MKNKVNNSKNLQRRQATIDDNGSQSSDSSSEDISPSQALSQAHNPRPSLPTATSRPSTGEVASNQPPQVISGVTANNNASYRAVLLQTLGINTNSHTPPSSQIHLATTNLLRSSTTPSAVTSTTPPAVTSTTPPTQHAPTATNSTTSAATTTPGGNSNAVGRRGRGNVPSTPSISNRRAESTPAASTISATTVSPPLLQLDIVSFLTHLRAKGSTLLHQNRKIISTTTKALFNISTAVLSNPSDIQQWRKLFSIIPIVFSTQDKVQVLDFLTKVLNNQWEEITLAYVENIINSRKAISGNRAGRRRSNQDVSSDTKMYRRAEKFLKAGRLGKALQVMERSLDETTLVDSTAENIISLLQSKHPQPIPQYIPNNTAIQFVERLSPPQPDDEDDDSYQRLIMSGPDFHELVMSSKKLISPGLDGIRADHLKVLLGYRDHQSKLQEELATNFATICNFLLLGDPRIPTEVSQALSSTLLVALTKSSTDVRPIGMGMLFRKYASFHLLNRVKVESLDSYFSKGFQFALHPAGLEEVIHNIEAARSYFPHYDVFNIDATNAFNSSNRLLGLYNIAKEFPIAIPLLRTMYMKPSKGYYFHSSAELGSMTHTVIPSCEGFHQGDVLGTWAYIMSLQPLLISLDEHLKSFVEENLDRIEAPILQKDGRELISLFFVDDGNLVGPHCLMVEAIKYLQERDLVLDTSSIPTKANTF